MIPPGFIDWSSPLKPELGDAIIVLHVEADGGSALARGMARDLAATYGRQIVAWRRDETLPLLPDGAAWQRFPDEIPRPRTRVVAAFIDTIGWRALSRSGVMGPRRYEPHSQGLAVYVEGLPFGAMLDRRPFPGFPDCRDRLRWAAFGWRPATPGDLHRAG